MTRSFEQDYEVFKSLSDFMKSRVLAAGEGWFGGVSLGEADSAGLPGVELRASSDRCREIYVTYGREVGREGLDALIEGYFGDHPGMLELRRESLSVFGTPFPPVMKMFYPGAGNQAVPDEINKLLDP